MLAARQHPIGCSNIIPNTFQWVRHPQNTVWGPTTHNPGQINTIFGEQLEMFGRFCAKTDFYFVLAALQPPICCSNTTANTCPWVLSRPRRSSMILQKVRAFESKEPSMVMKTKDNGNKPHHSECLSIWFSQSVQHRTKCIINTKKNTVFGKKRAIHGHFSVKTDFYFVLAALQPPTCCSNTTANTLQWVPPRPRRSSMILQNVCAFGSKERPMLMKTRNNRNKPHHSEHLSIWFSQSVQHHTKCIMNTELRHLHFQRYNPAVFTNTAINSNLQALNSTKFLFWRGKKQKTYMQVLLKGPVHWKTKGLHAVHGRTKLLHGLHGLHGHLELVHVHGWHWHGNGHGNWHVHL